MGIHPQMGGHGSHAVLKKRMSGRSPALASAEGAPRGKQSLTDQVKIDILFPRKPGSEKTHVLKLAFNCGQQGSSAEAQDGQPIQGKQKVR